MRGHDRRPDRGYRENAGRTGESDQRPCKNEKRDIEMNTLIKNELLNDPDILDKMISTIAWMLDSGYGYNKTVEELLSDLRNIEEDESN